MNTLYIKAGTIAALICLQMLAALSAWSFLNSTQAGGDIPRGVKINDVPVGGLTGEQARRLLQEKFAGNLKQTLVIHVAGESVSLRPMDIGANFDYAGAVGKALALGEPAGVLAGATRNLALLAGMQNIPLPVQIHRSKLADELKTLQGRVNTQSRPATILWQQNRRAVLPEEYGRKLDIDATLDKVTALRPPLPSRIDAVTVPEPARVTAKDLEPLKNILGECATGLDPALENRTANIALAVNSLNNTLVKPGAVFSFNERVGERSLGNGYSSAPVIDGNRTVEDLGGGICQVSSTLYHALLTANLEVVERHPHTKTVGYISPGLDATVVDGQKDLRFRNSRGHPVFITGVLEDGRVKIQLWGVMSDNEPRIEIETRIEPLNPKTIIHKNDNMPLGKQTVLSEGERGYVAGVYQVIRGTYGETKKLVTRDYYAPENRVVIVGTGGASSPK